MTWEDPRPAMRAATGAARQVAHAEDAKHRIDEASATRVIAAPRARPKWLAPVLAGAAVMVVLAGAGALALTGGSDSADPSPEPPGTTAAESPTAEPTEGTAVEDTQPRGVYTVTSKLLPTDLRGGGTRKEAGAKPATWTFKPDGCTDTECVGTIKSSSGAKISYVYDGTGLKLAREPVTSPKEACVDTVTGEVRPIEESAAIHHYKYSYDPLRFQPGEPGEPPQLASWRVRGRVTIDFFGDCEPDPTNPVQYNAILTMRRT